MKRLRNGISIILILAGLFAVGSSAPIFEGSNSPSGLSLGLINFNPIFINDTDPDHNWTTFISNHPLVSGSGEPNDPYIIRRANIDASGCLFGITVLNSNKFFYIQNSVLFNTDPNGDSSGIRFSNVTFGFVLGSEIYNNKHFGIEAVNSSIILIGNHIHDNHESGVYLEKCRASFIPKNRVRDNNGHGFELVNCSNIGLIDNQIFYNTLSGVSLIHTEISQIDNNTIYNNGHGICLSNSSDNLIEGNTIYNNRECGIHLRRESNNTHISNNNINNNPNCISLGSTCKGTTGNNINEDSVNMFDESPPENTTDFLNWFDIPDLQVPLTILGATIISLVFLVGVAIIGLIKKD